MTIRPISQLLEDFSETLPPQTVSLDHVLEAFHERGFGFLILLIALPMALPVPFPPGLNIIISLPLLVLTAQQALGRHTVWMPEKFRRRAIGARKIKTTIDNVLPWARRLEILIRPRLGFITQGASSRLIGVLGFVMALVGCIPLPLTNTVPAMGIALMAAGVIMRDGLAVIAGALVGTAWIALLSYAAVTYGPEGIELIRNWITG